jgi:hypothetical protein
MNVALQINVALRIDKARIEPFLTNPAVACFADRGANTKP